MNFATGQALDIERLTAAGHDAGAVVGWDLAHAAGNVELALHDWRRRLRGVVHVQVPERRTGLRRSDLRPRAPRPRPRRSRVSAAGGGSTRNVRFDPMDPFVPAAGAAGWATSTTSIIALAPGRRVAGDLRRDRDAGAAGAVRGADRLPRGACSDDVPIEVITPRDPAARGAQLSLRHDDAEALLDRLAARGVVADYRAPDLIRVAPIPLYTTYHDAWRLADVLRRELVTR